MSIKFKPCYVWPNNAFPFRHYFSSSVLNIFIIENLVHNYNWLNEFKYRIRDDHFFFVICGWHHDQNMVNHVDHMFKNLRLNKHNFYIMFNSEIEGDNFINKGFRGQLINHNCWLDENVIKPKSNTEKIYDAILISRRADFKRHYLASKVRNLALVSGGSNHGRNISYTLPKHVYNNKKQLSTDEICTKISQSHCGLMLSAMEGACFSSSEYLLCGIPIVSTKSLGGRDFWYDEYNSIICEDNEESVKNSVISMVENSKDGLLIRQKHIDIANKQRQTFVHILQETFNRFGLDINANDYFKHTFYHKMRNSIRPDFKNIFNKQKKIYR